MMGRTASACLIALLGFAVAGTAAAQPPRVEVSGGYQSLWAADQTFALGWGAGITTRIAEAWDAVGEGTGAWKTEDDGDLGADVKLSIYSAGVGARWSRRGTAAVVPFLQLLAGVTRVKARAEILGTEVGDSSVSFMLQPGGGVKLRLNGTLGLVGQADYRRVFLDDRDGESSENQFRVLVGVCVGF